MPLVNRTDQLEGIISQFVMLHKATIKQYGQPADGLTPILRKVVVIVGTEVNANIKQLAAALEVTSGAATQHVTALEDLGYVERQASSQDRREVVVHLTASGKKMCHEIKSRMLVILESMFNELNDQELQQLTELMHKVRNKNQS